jgi:hypothetical protein
VSQRTCRKPLPEPAALAVILELLLDIPRQGLTPRRQVGLERRKIFLDKLIKEEALRAVPPVDRRADTRIGVPAVAPQRAALGRNTGRGGGHPCPFHTCSVVVLYAFSIWQRTNLISPTLAALGMHIRVQHNPAGSERAGLKETHRQLVSKFTAALKQTSSTSRATCRIDVT